ncbi:zinc-ribbon and DUF3426 domain-containing protein [Variovorax sp. LARHSF232]
MRLVTRCPACATTFKVVRDQLRISDGWVRCGRCSEVFDATLDLHETDEEGVPIVPPPASLAQGAASTAGLQPGRPQAQENLLPPSTLGAGLPAMSWPAADLLDLGPKSPSLPTAPAAESEDPVPIPTLDGSELGEEPWFDEVEFDAKASSAPLAESAAALAASLSASSSASPSARQEPGFTPSLTAPSPIEEAVNAQLQKALRRERIKALRSERAQQKERERAEQPGAPAAKEEAAQPGTPEPVPEALLLEAPSAPVGLADETADAQGESSGRLRRVLIAAGCLLALVLLVLQVMRHERDTLAAREPRLRPVLQALCEWSSCEISALRQIGAITIDGASFSREKEGDGYRLVFTLRNGARIPLAMPSVELTLLDTQERALVRRVLSPAQFGAPAVLGPNAERSASLPLQLAGSQAEGLAPVAGYRLIAFYP